MLRPESNRANASSHCAPSKKTIVLVLLLLTAPILYVIVGSSTNEVAYESYVPSRFSLKEMRSFAVRKQLSMDYRSGLYTRVNLSFSRILEDVQNRFDIKASDVIVFVHIQKTAGTSFEKFLVKYLELERPCDCSRGKKKCTCTRPNSRNEIWLFSRYSTGWMCGLHADFTEMYASGCVAAAMDKKEGFHRNRRYFYTSFLREPVARFISEYRHVNRGATWIASRHMCNGRPPTPDELPLCFDPQLGWEEVSLDEFLHCPFNLAFNRQTRMLADLTLVDCYSRSSMDRETRDRIMLESAKNNLRNLAYFGIKERMDDSQFLFEQIFSMRFIRNLSDWHRSKSNDTKITADQLILIRQKNRLDLELYDYAIELFESRLELLRKKGKMVRIPVLNATTSIPDEVLSTTKSVSASLLNETTIQYDSSESDEMSEEPSELENTV